MAELNASIKDIMIPPAMRSLPISAKGFPVPWFVAWMKDGKPTFRGNGDPDFRVIQPSAVAEAHVKRRCWLCGGVLGKFMSFTIGPMCAVSRISAEPPSHRDCALYAVKACPFLTKPNMRRNDKDLPPDRFVKDGHIDRNPGVTLIWSTLTYKVAKQGGNGYFRLGEPVSTDWFCQGRPATRNEVLASIESGLPLLEEQARKDGMLDELPSLVAIALTLVP